MNDDITYGILLLIGIGIGPCIRNIKNVSIQKKVSAVAGFGFTLFAGGWDVIHPLTLTLVNSFIVLLSGKRICHILSFLFCFTYMILVRVGYYFGMQSPPIYGSAIQMYMTLKMVGLAFDAHDTYIQQIDAKQPMKTRNFNSAPLLNDIICYSFCHAGILSGPYFKFQTYMESFQGPTSKFRSKNILPHLIKRLTFLPLCIIIFIILQSQFSSQYTISEEMLQRSILYRVWYTIPVALGYRIRLVSLFLLSEGQCITMAIGMYDKKCLSRSGYGPTILTHFNDKNGHDVRSIPEQDDVSAYDFQTIRSINVWKCEFAITAMDFTNNWNMTVQYWLYWYVYKRLPFQRSYRTFATAFVSGIWHGVEPAYLVWAGTMFFVIFTQTIVTNAFQNVMNRKGQLLLNFINWFLGYIIYLYAAMAFVLVDTVSLFTYLKSVHFYGHFLLAMANIVCINIHVKAA